MSGWKYYPYHESGNYCETCIYYDPDHDDEWPLVDSPGDTCAAEHSDCPGRQRVLMIDNIKCTIRSVVLKRTTKKAAQDDLDKYLMRLQKVWKKEPEICEYISELKLVPWKLRGRG